MSPEIAFQKFSRSVCRLTFFDGTERISSGSGFLAGGHLITCAHVLQRLPHARLEIVFPSATGSQTPTWDVPAGASSLKCVGGSEENSHDYAIIEPPIDVDVGPDLNFAPDLPKVGTRVCSLGFPFEDPDITLSIGIVSSIRISGVATLLKLDMSVNPGNSGGPLLDLNTGLVVGVVSRKATGLSRAFANLSASFDKNIVVLQSYQNYMNISGFDPAHALLATQVQLKQVAQELERSAQIGIGWAVYVDPLRKEPPFQND